MAYELFLLDERSMSRTSIAISVYDEATDDIIMPMHTKATDMWAFGMVIYVSNEHVLIRAASNPRFVRKLFLGSFLFQIFEET